MLHHSQDSEEQVTAQARKQNAEAKSARPKQGDNNNLGKTGLEQKPKPYMRIPRRFAGMDTSVIKHAGCKVNHEITSGDAILAGNDIASVISTKKGSLNIRERIKVLKEMDTLLPSEVGKLVQFVESGVKPEGMRDSSYHWLVDQIFTTARDLSGDPGNLTKRLAAIASREGADLVVRDYAVQHLGHLQHEGGDMQAIRSVLEKTTGETQGTLAGSALLALQSGGYPQEAMVKQAIAIAGNPSYPTESRITALQIAAEDRTEELLFLARGIMSREDTNAHLKVVARSILSTSKN